MWQSATGEHGRQKEDNEVKLQSRHRRVNCPAKTTHSTCTGQWRSSTERPVTLYVHARNSTIFLYTVVATRDQQLKAKAHQQSKANLCTLARAFQCALITWNQMTDLTAVQGVNFLPLSQSFALIISTSWNVEITLWQWRHQQIVQYKLRVVTNYLKILGFVTTNLAECTKMALQRNFYLAANMSRCIY
jgi:hypothetical protein